MMMDNDMLELQAGAACDQVAAHMRDKMVQIRYIAKMDPSDWSEVDIQIIKGTLYGVLAFLQIGRI